MPEKEFETVEEVIAITDPGEAYHDQYLWGDRLMIKVGNCAAWIFPLLMVAIVVQVIIRKLGYNQAWLDDAQWWMYGLAMMVGFGYAITTTSHVRVDIFYQNYSAPKKSKIEVFALGWLLLPFLILMTDILLHYAGASIKANEGSDSANGLHMLYLLKSSLPLLFGCAIIATVSSMWRNLTRIGEVNLIAVTFGAFPAIIFSVERLIYYTLYWFVRITNPDISARRINKEPLLEHTSVTAMVIVLMVMLLGYLRLRIARSESK